ncbi:DUF1828 domain-containing protein [Vineibacter terrae]|uniref:DUF1828 domain-containing protein n=1 Tax=Vineibacter terrae TaxID=2586908 RepID=A0A5C8PGG8_9HYPH|nr:DUF1828 domain-containing protein [Vineibacter terrae]TXL72273.1 DUF1828 domain-containing protein [Vineibacter terrae]
MNDRQFCKAFCDEVALREVPLGYVLKTPFRRDDGDAIAIYIRRHHELDAFRLEDDGQTIGYLEAAGVDLDADSRFEALTDLMREYAVHYDERGVLLHTGYVHEANLPALAVKFSAFLLRVYDLLLLARNRVRSTFRDDLIAMVESQFGASCRIDLNVPLQESMKDYVIDILVRSPGNRVLAIYAGTSEMKALEALLFWRESREQKVQHVRSMLVLEEAKPRDIKDRTLSRVMNSDILLASMDGEEIAIRRKMEFNLLN